MNNINEKNTINYTGCIVVYQFYRERAIETERERDGVQIQILLQICMVGKSYYNSIISLSRIFVISYISARNNDKKNLYIVHRCDVSLIHFSVYKYLGKMCAKMWAEDITVSFPSLPTLKNIVTLYAKKK